MLCLERLRLLGGVRGCFCIVVGGYRRFVGMLMCLWKSLVVSQIPSYDAKTDTFPLQIIFCELKPATYLVHIPTCNTHLYIKRTLMKEESHIK